MTGHTKFDFIGDIHGHADVLKKLLTKLGYYKEQGIYLHPTRQAFFVGDFIDRGPEVSETLEIVKNMVDAGFALAVMGNHEYNFIQLHTRSVDDPSEWARSHDKRDQAKTTFQAFDGKKEELEMYINWFKTLPIYFETDYFRVVHAQWDARSIEKINKYCYSDNECDCSGLLNEEHFGHREGEVHDAIEILLKGYELKLPDGIKFQDKYDKKTYREEMRVKWWLRGINLNHQDVADNGIDLPSEFGNQKYEHKAYQVYEVGQVPVFFGHYWLPPDQLGLMQKNICCLDFSIAKGGVLTAYRYNGERELSGDNFVFV